MRREKQSAFQAEVIDKLDRVLAITGPDEELELAVLEMSDAEAEEMLDEMLRTYEVDKAASKRKAQRDSDYLAVEVIDTLNDRVVQHVRGDGQHEEKFQKFVDQYGSRGDEYVVQIIDTKTDEIIKDNQGSDGVVREFNKKEATGNPEVWEKAELIKEMLGADAAFDELIQAMDTNEANENLDHIIQMHDLR